MLSVEVEFDSVEQLIPDSIKAKVQKRKAELLPDDKIVGLTGDTYRYKDDIKALALRAGTMAKWDSARRAWVVQYVVYKQLIERYPNAANNIDIVTVA